MGLYERPNAIEQFYNDGFIDGQEEVIDNLLEIIELEGPTGGTEEALRLVVKYLNERKKEIESL